MNSTFCHLSTLPSPSKLIRQQPPPLWKHHSRRGFVFPTHTYPLPGRLSLADGLCPSPTMAIMWGRQCFGKDNWPWLASRNSLQGYQCVEFVCVEGIGIAINLPAAAIWAQAYSQLVDKGWITPTLLHPSSLPHASQKRVCSLWLWFMFGPYLRRSLS